MEQIKLNTDYSEQPGFEMMSREEPADAETTDYMLAEAGVGKLVSQYNSMDSVTQKQMALAQLSGVWGGFAAAQLSGLKSFKTLWYGLKAVWGTYRHKPTAR